MKQFLEEYGFAILAAIVVILLITFATPIGHSIQKSINSTIDQTTAKEELKMKEINNTNDVESFQKDLTEEYSEFHKTHPDIDYNMYSKNVVEVTFKQLMKSIGTSDLTLNYSNMDKMEFLEENIIRTKAGHRYGGWKCVNTDLRQDKHIYFLSATVMQEVPSGVYIPTYSKADLNFTSDLEMSGSWEHKYVTGKENITIYNSKTHQLELYDPKNSDWNYVYTKNVIFVDLTEVFGEGNEPSAAEFDAMVGDNYYDYGWHTIYVYMPDIKSLSSR